MKTPFPNPRQKRGREGEDIAAAYLRWKGAQIVTVNWRPTGWGLRGELDIVAKYNGCLCFVEVKTRSSNVLGEPQEAVTLSKQRKISRLADAFVQAHELFEATCRFDIVEVWLRDDEKPRVAWIENAFEYQA